MEIIFLILFYIPTIWTLIPEGYFYTHDGVFHLVRLIHFYNELSAGQFPVRWFHELAFGYGYPLPNYIYPLLYYLGSIFHFIGLSFGDSIKMVILVASLGSVLAFYKWLRCHFDILPAFVGALFYAYTPYRFLATYVNGSFGSTLAFLFVPLILLFMFKLILEGKFQALPFLSLSFAGLLLSHNVSALMFLPLILIYGFYLWFKKNLSLKILINFSKGFVLGLGLAAFFIIPAILEVKYVRLGLGSVVNYKDHYPALNQLIYSKWGYGFSNPGLGDGQSFQIGIAQIFVVNLVFLILAVRALTRKIILKESSLAVVMLAFLLLVIFLMLEHSQFLWVNLPILQYIQFPWRLLAVLMVITSFIAAYFVSQYPKLSVAIFLIAMLLISNRNYLRVWEAKRYTDEHFIFNKSLFNGSTDIAWEALPVWVKSNPKDFAPSKVFVSNVLNVTQQPTQKGEHLRFQIEASNSAKAVFSTFYFPSWQLTLDYKKIPITPSDEGLISADILSGNHLVILSLKSTLLERLSNAISIVSLIILGFLIFSPKKFISK